MLPPVCNESIYRHGVLRQSTMVPSSDQRHYREYPPSRANGTQPNIHWVGLGTAWCRTSAGSEIRHNRRLNIRHDGTNIHRVVVPGGLKILILNGSGLQIQTNGMTRTSAGSGGAYGANIRGVGYIRRVGNGTNIRRVGM